MAANHVSSFQVVLRLAPFARLGQTRRLAVAGRPRSGIIALLLLLASLVITPASAGAAGPLAAGKTDRQALQRMQDKDLLKDIAAWEKQGGPDAAARIWVVMRNLEQHRLEVLNAAVAALGRLKRPEDGPALIEWYGTTEQKDTVGMFSWSLMPALGLIGGPPVCRFLTDNLRETDRGPDFNIDLVPLARAICAAGCLPEEKLRPEARAILLDPSLPWWVKRSVFDGFSHAPIAKEDLLDLCFSLASLIYTQRPGWYAGEYTVREWGRFIISFDQSAWNQTAGESYLEKQRRTLRAQLTPEAFGCMSAMIDSLLASQRAQEARRREEAAPWAAAASPAHQPASAGDAPPVRPDLPSRIRETPFPEPGFFTVKTRMQRLEIFGFDKAIRWLGLARTELALAAGLQEIVDRGTPEAAKREREAALVMVVVESRAAEAAAHGEPESFPVWRVPVRTSGEKPVGESHGNPETGEASLTFLAGEERLVLLRAAGTTGCDLDVVRSGASPGEGNEEDVVYRYPCGALQAGAWLAVHLDKAGGRPVVFLPGRKKALDGTGIHVGREGDREERIPGQAVATDLQRWFEDARKALESWEKTTLESAGGAAGVRRFRKELAGEIAPVLGR